MNFSFLKSKLYSKNVQFNYFGESESGELLNSEKHAKFKKSLVQVFGKSEIVELDHQTQF